MKVLGIETSCDETGVAVYDTQKGLLGHELFSQVELHAQYGGVVPELASRDHIRKALPLVKSVLQKSNTYAWELDAVAYTAGPGLAGALLVGAMLGRSISWSMSLPAVPVHHMEGHLLAVMLEKRRPPFPFLALLISGGHTLLVEVVAVGKYVILGESLDDAAGEAFDKTAKLLGLGYPGGPALAKFAEQGDPSRYQFPRPMTDRPGLDFSFSGLKTFALNTLAESQGTPSDRANIARAFEEAVADTLYIKCKRALAETGLDRLVIAGGVGANQRIRTRLTDLGVDLYFPRPEFCTDNGAMIAYVGAVRARVGQYSLPSVEVKPRWPIDEIEGVQAFAAA